MGRTLYLECTSGIAGDMLVASLLDLGADEGRLRRALATLPVPGFDASVSRVSRSGLDACDFDVVLGEGYVNHDHDTAWLHGHGTDDGGRGQGHGHRGLADVLAVIGTAQLAPRAARIAERAFRILADAEAAAHGTTPERVHFHEVGAVDSIVDVVSAAVCLDDLDVDRVIVPSLSDGRGTIRCAHGVIPIPVPAVTSIVATYGLPLRVTDVEGELVTPTGAALVAAIRTGGALPESFLVRRVGLGAGKRGYDCPELLRAMIVEPTPAGADGRVWKLECDVDDCTPEALGYVLGRLIEAGAREAHYLPIYMKKNRPAWQLQVICPADRVEELERIVFEDTTTIGIRRAQMERTALEREVGAVETSIGTVRTKVVRMPDGDSRAYPEYEDVASLSREFDLPFQEVWREALAACGECRG